MEKCDLYIFSETEEASPSIVAGPLVVISFYKFSHFPDFKDLRNPLKSLSQKLRVSGGIILSPEGVNGSICGSRESVTSLLRFLEAGNGLTGIRRVELPVSREDAAPHQPYDGTNVPFRWDHVRVKLKKEIVSLGMPHISPVEKVGTFIIPRNWNSLIRDPDTMVIDVRNTYETRLGKFRGAIDPHTRAFREFPAWVEDEFEAPSSSKKRLPRVAMYCTGGIRCEKASSYLLQNGFNEVYHLEGGILRYLEEVEEAESEWEGECFVFDRRVSVRHGLGQGSFKLCYGCKQPVCGEDIAGIQWEEGVSCPHCFFSKSGEEKERARARHKQFEDNGWISGCCPTKL